MAVSTLTFVLILGSLPAIGTLVGTVLADRFQLNGRQLSVALHAAAGGLTAVVAVELMPRALAFMSPWLVILAFVAGGAFLIAVDWATEFISDIVVEDPEEADAIAKGPWVLLVGVGVDLITDGIMIGAGARVDVAIAILLGVGLLVADVAESFATFATLRKKGVSRGLRFGLGGALAALIVITAVGGYIILRPLPEVYSMLILAFTAGVLMTVVVEEMAPHAHAGGDGRKMTAAYLGGFSAFAFIAALLG